MHNIEPANKTQKKGVVSMKAAIRVLLVACLLFFFEAAGAAQIDGLRMWPSPDGTRLVFDISSPVEHNVFVLKHPHRVVIDFKNTTQSQEFSPGDFGETLLSGIRSATRNKYDMRVVLDTKVAVKPKSFVLRPMGQYGHRLVLDLEGQLKTESPTQQVPVKTLRGTSESPRPIIVAIDAGHGGEDPGAIGKRGTHEKDIVYSIAKKLEALLQKEPGIKPVMIRSGDYYISLRNRIRKARTHKADLFVSIHADAAHNRRARGASVFVLSQKGASSEAARWLATTQNNADLVGGVSLDDKDDLLASVLLDLSQNATIAASTEVGATILNELGNINRLHKRTVERAGFVVLKSPDIPSILVETGFISNTREEKKLRNARHQHDIALALRSGVKRYFKKYPPAGSLYAMAPTHHVIAKGETISSIAKKYNVSLSLLMQFNRLKNDVLSPGAILRIPVISDNS